MEDTYTSDRQRVAGESRGALGSNRLIVDSMACCAAWEPQRSQPLLEPVVKPHVAMGAARASFARLCFPETAPNIRPKRSWVVGQMGGGSDAPAAA